MLTIQQAHQKWGVSEKTVKRAIREKRIRSFEQDGRTFIPDDEIYALPKKAIQAVLWTIVEYKNDPDSVPDISTIDKISPGQMQTVFKHLIYRKYLDKVDGSESVDDCYKYCRITKLGISLIQKKPLPGSPLSKDLIESGLVTIIPAVFNWLSKYILIS